MEKEQWVDSIVESPGKIGRVSPRDSLFDEIRTRIGMPDMISASTIWFAAATIALLAVLNAAIIAWNSRPQKMQVMSEVAFDSTNQLYTNG